MDETTIEQLLMASGLDDRIVTMHHFALVKKFVELVQKEVVKEITVTSNQKGEVVAVTRTDEDYRILEVIWMRSDKPCKQDLVEANEEFLPKSCPRCGHSKVCEKRE